MSDAVPPAPAEPAPAEAPLPEAPERLLFGKPLEAWLNPVAWKDLLTFAKGQNRSPTPRVMGVLAAVGLLIYAWAAMAFPGGWRFATRPVFLVVVAVLALFHFAVAVPAATALALERDRDTLDGLIVSPLSPWRLVVGKWLAAIGLGAVSKAALLPALGIAYVLGGVDLGFIPAFLALVVAADGSFAAFALLVGARHLEAPRVTGWLRPQVNQTQLALQQSLGLAVLTSLVPIYATLVLIPIGLQQGFDLAQAFDMAAPLGALHPLIALLLWGDVNLFGLRLPVWLVGVIFHVLLALPMLAEAAEAQRGHDRTPGRAGRLLGLPALVFGLLIAGALANGLGPMGRVLVGCFVPLCVILFLCGRTAFTRGLVDPPVRIRGVLAGLHPFRALQSHPASAPGFALLMALLCAPLVVWSAGVTSA
ncbi:hypothetical protein OAX78_01110, partial [Planctomycetota bacterium]|nr:hypothetical protein [Planctomycetota bacterium]